MPPRALKAAASAVWTSAPSAIRTTTSATIRVGDDRATRGGTLSELAQLKRVDAALEAGDRPVAGDVLGLRPVLLGRIQPDAGCPDAFLLDQLGVRSPHQFVGRLLAIPRGYACSARLHVWRGRPDASDDVLGLGSGQSGSRTANSSPPQRQRRSTSRS